MKTDFGLKEGDLLAIQRILEQNPQVNYAMIFGSRAKGNYKPGSDIDIALIGDNLGHSVVNHISYVLNEETNMPYRFDVLDYHSIQEPALTEHIDRVGIVFYERSMIPQKSENPNQDK